MKLFLNMKTAMSVTLVGFGLFCFYSCNQVGNGYGLDSNGDLIPFKAPDTNLALVQTIFTARCIICHGNASGVGYNGTKDNTTPGLDLTDGHSYASLFGNSGTGQISYEHKANPLFLRVKPGSPDSSYLYEKIIASPSLTVTRMPLGGNPYLSDDQIKVIKRWIELGAPQ